MIVITIFFPTKMKPDQMHASDSSPGLLEKIVTTEFLIFKENLQILGQHPDTYYRNSPEHQAEIIFQQLGETLSYE